ncbi:phosphatidylserine decarboxylase [Streptococcus moroccensis]|uniref:Phosphatidylserine decarboxylase n=1 Tax=Streptococcus moroccensis TaxID=1451356 RepID=A0ABT9YR69_9STRE|nr:phosphatidylserine decarboxylase [Streptococcus moroccensis]MDQ0222392.1 phosphatidylserine decarboxylase [Streptococcus moroccensis]
MTQIYHKEKRQLIDLPDYQSQLVDKLYKTKWGRFLQPIVTWPPFSELLLVKEKLPSSRRKIQTFCDTYQINLAEFETRDYPHFAAFFTRTPLLKARPRCSEEQVMAVADAKLRVQSISAGETIVVKGQIYPLAELLQDQTLASLFEGGWLCLYRLGVEDVHRYLYAETGPVLASKRIPGKLHSIRDMVHQELPVFKENRRAFEVYQTSVGQVLQMEVGALLVGAIHNPGHLEASRGQEKGYFSLGGSSILVLYQKNKVSFDQEILEYSKRGIEVQVKMGQAIGRKKENTTCYQD